LYRKPKQYLTIKARNALICFPTPAKEINYDQTIQNFKKVIALDKNDTLVQASQQEINKLSSPVPQTTP
jgi:hypothetical protein